MPIKSNRDGHCYDCGVEWKEGETIDANGHKTKAGKDYWCKNGKNCQGVMQLQGGDNPSNRFGGNAEANPSDGTLDHLQAEAQKALHQAERTVSKEEPTPAEIMDYVRGQGVLDEDIIRRDEEDIEKACLRMFVRKAKIEKMMNEVGIKHPSRVSFMTEVMRRLS